MRVEQLAINTMTLRQAGFEEALAAVATAGFRQIEFVLPLVKAWLAEGHSVADARQRLAAHGLQAIGGFEAPVVCFADDAACRCNHDLQLENARLIHDLGGGTLVIGTDGPERPSVDALETVATTARDLLDRLEGLDVTIALEFNWGPLVKSLESAVRVCEQVDHPRLGVLFDPAHYQTTVTKFEHLTATNVRWIKHVHLNDMAAKPGDLSGCNADRVLPGEGVLDLPTLIGAIEQHGYNGAFSLEMFSTDLWQLPATEAARRGHQSLLPFCDV